MRTSVGWTQDGNYQCIGMGTANTEEGCLYSGDQNGVGTTNCASRYANNRIIKIKNGDPTSGTFYEAELLSTGPFVTGSFKLNWLNAPVTAFEINYICIGGTEVTAKMVAQLTPGSNTTANFTGYGDEPDGVIVATSLVTSSGDVTNGAGLGMGATDGTNQQCSFSVAKGDVGTTKTRRIQTAQLINIIDNDGTERDRGSFNTFHSDGFTVDFTNTNTTQYRFLSIALFGVEMEVGVETTKTSTGIKTTNTSIEPKALLLGSVLNTNSSSVVNDAALEVGGSSGSNSGENINSGGVSRNNLATSISYEFTLNGITYRAYTTTGLIRHTAKTDAFNTANFTLNYTQAIAVEYEFWYLVFGDVKASALSITPSPTTFILATNGPFVTTGVPGRDDTYYSSFLPISDFINDQRVFDIRANANGIDRSIHNYFTRLLGELGELQGGKYSWSQWDGLDTQTRLSKWQAGVSGGTFNLTFNLHPWDLYGESQKFTLNLAYNVSAATLKSSIDSAASDINDYTAGDIQVTGGPLTTGNMTLQFGYSTAYMNQPNLVLDYSNLTGGGPEYTSPVVTTVGHTKRRAWAIMQIINIIDPAADPPEPQGSLTGIPAITGNRDTIFLQPSTGVLRAIAKQAAIEDGSDSIEYHILEGLRQNGLGV
jgi:hypothetical protein